MSRWLFALCGILILSSLAVPSAHAEYCCERYGLFVPVEMPPEQERDCSGMLDAAMYGTLREGPTRDCPIQWEEMSYSGRAFLQWMVDTIGTLAQAPPDPQAKRQFEKMLDCDYAWKAKLTLHKVDETVEGYTEEGYEPGSTNYEPGYVLGDWTLELKLVNIHFNEVVEQGQIDFSGSCTADGGEAMKDLVRAYFIPIGPIVFEYEQAPMSCFIDCEVDSIEAGVKTTLHVKDLWDAWSKPAKEWQRIVVKVEHGEILNGVRCSEDENAYAFKVGGGDVEIEYIAEQDCQDKMETFTVYNSCQWGLESARPMQTTDMEEELESMQIKVYDRRPDTCSIRPAVHPIEAGENVIVQIKNVKDDKDSRVGPQERLMVRAAKGKIVNGMPKNDYKVFEVGQGTVQVEYEAPNDCGISKDTFFVYEACVSGEEYLDVTPGDKVGEKELKITCDWTWTGQMTLEYRDDFSCEHVEDNKNSTYTINYSEQRTQIARLNIRADNILEGDAIMDVRIGDDWEVFGDLNVEVDDRHENKNVHKKQRERQLEELTHTRVDQLFTLNSDNVSLVVSRDPGDFEDASKKMQEMVAEIMASGGDEKQIEEAMKSVDQMFSVGESSVPLRFVAQVSGEFIGAITGTRYRKVDDSVEVNEENTTQGPVGLPMAAEFTGKLTREANGGGTIEGEGHPSESVPAGTGIECPDRRRSVNVYLNMSARQKKD